MEFPLVSVVLCCYNGAKHLAEQVESILNQTYKNIELIIADDASTDNTAEIARRFESHHNVKVIVREKNLGLSANFYDAAMKSKGDFIAFSDQDDIWLPGKIETLLGNIGKYPLVYSDSLLVNESGKSLDKKLSDLRNMYSGDDSRGYIFYTCVWGHGMLVKKKLLLDARPFPPGIHHDVWLAFIAFSNGGIKYHDEVLTLYRQHSGSTSKTLAEKMPSRKKEKRYRDFLKQLEWIGLMKDHERKEYHPFYETLYNLYARKGRGKYVFSLFLFLIANREHLFMFSKKNYLSQLIEIAKQAKGESS
jgi:glycosyltransferase involved in cell wall biosynthesis